MVSIRHVKNGGNRVDNALAKMSFEMEELGVWLEETPSYIMNFGDIN